MQQQFYHSQMVPHLQYGPNSTAQQPPTNPKTISQVAYFNSSMRSKQTAIDQQLAMFGKFSAPTQKPPLPMLNTNVPFGGEVYNDESSNIYTEPTLIDHNVGHGNIGRPGGITSNLISAPLPPPPPLPPIFTVSVMDAATTTSSTLNDTNMAFPGSSGVSSVTAMRNNAKVFAGKDTDSLSFVDMITSQSCESVVQHPSHSHLTITGQDLEITLNNGEITQTVLRNPADVPSATGLGAPMNPQLLYYSNQRIEFLPLCDLLFNIISLAAYFCDVVFDSVTAYTLYLNDQILWLFIALMLILTSAILSQLLSYKWYLRERRFREQMHHLQRIEHPSDTANDAAILSSPYELRSPFTLAITHIFLGGVLLRYFKLFVPVNLSTVKREVRDLCVLRMVHGFCQAGPMLLLQVYLVWMKPVNSITDLNIISIFLSLFSLCWALSSFSKNIRKCQIHKLVLTWLGVIFQFFWRIGTVTSRIVALTIYATVYQQWIFVVLFLHWFSMLLWLSTPTINAHNIIEEGAAKEKKPTCKDRIKQNALIAWVYIFCFINMENTNPRHRMTAFYFTMFLENALLLCISLFFDNEPMAQWYRSLAYYLVFGSFFFGIFFMWLYYRFFHIRHLKHTLDCTDVENSYNFNQWPNYPNCQNEPSQNILIDGELFSYEPKGGNQLDGHMFVQTKTSPMSRLVNALSNQIFPGCYHTPAELSKQSASGRYRHHFNNDNIPGVFNCRLNPALKRKKKKPSTIPPPPLSGSTIAPNSSMASETGVQQREPLETIDEVLPIAASNSKQLVSASVHLPDSFTVRPNQYRRNMLHQIQRPSTNTSILTRQLRQPSADTFWRKSALSARSLSISPSAMLKSENSFRLPAKHPFSSTITTPTSPVNFMPTENFTDKLEVCIEQNQSNANREVKPSEVKAIIRPKPIVQNSINLDETAHDFFDDGSYANESHAQQFVAKQPNGTLLHYYYNPQSGKLKLRSQTPEVLLYPHTDSSRIFYDYPSTVISIPNVDVEKNDDEDLIFTRQCQRPPVPGREGDDKSEENDNDNCSYVEGKRSLLNYGMSRARLEKILEKKQEERYEVDSHTLPNEARVPVGKSKHSRYATGQLKKKKKYKSKKNKRTSLRAISKLSIHSSDSRSTPPSNDAASLSSSGEDGDIESDINQHERVVPRQVTSIRASRADLLVNNRSQNVYDQVHSEQPRYEEAFGSSDGIEPHNGDLRVLLPPTAQTTAITAEVHHLGPDSDSLADYGPLPRIIRGPAYQFTASQDAVASIGGQKIANYHLASSEQTRPSNANQRSQSKRPNNGAAMARPKPLYHSAKYKRHNTPL